jgi:hypothetical protein
MPPNRQQLLTDALASNVPRPNQLVNGGFENWQRGNGPFTSNVFGPDRWQIFLNGTDTISVSRDTTHQDTGSTACAACTFVLGSGGGGSQLYQGLATFDYNQLTGRTVTIAVRVRTSTANAVRIATWDDVNGNSFGTTYHSGGGTYETITLTRTVPATATSLHVGVSFTASCTAYIDSVMLAIGPAAVDYIPLTPAEELARCLRYYETLGVPGSAEILYESIATAGGQNYRQTLPLKAWKPVNPTSTKVGTWNTANASSQPSIEISGQWGTRMIVTATAAGEFYTWNGNASTTVTVEANP